MRGRGALWDNGRDDEGENDVRSQPGVAAMTDQELAEIRTHWNRMIEWSWSASSTSHVARWGMDTVPRLLNEVRRLRDENAELRAVAKLVAASDGRVDERTKENAWSLAWCLYCTATVTGDEREALAHAPECPVARARELIAEAGGAQA